MFLLSEKAFADKIYQRKSVSYINALWLATPEAQKISPERATQLLESIKRGIEMERFDYNPLPDSLVQKFAQEAKKENILTPERAEELLKEIVVPTVIKVLNEQMEVRAKELISEEERNSFIVIKAKEIGLTAEHFEKILNSAYMYLPILIDYSHESVSMKVLTEDLKIVEKQGIGYTLKIGIIWFSLKVSGGKERVTAVKQIEVTAGGWDPNDSKAFTVAAKSLEDDLRIKTVTLYQFRLYGQVLECSNGKVEFDLGMKEGVLIDQKFRVYEKVEDRNGNYKLDKKGFFMVSYVGDNVSYGKPIIGTYDSGMLVEEFPRHNIDVLWRINTRSVNIALQFKINRETEIGIPMYFDFWRAGVSAGEENDKAYVGLYCTVIKKYYVKRFAFMVGYRYDYHKISEENWPGGVHLLSATTGIEVAMREDFYFGIMADFRGLGCEYIKESDSVNFHNPLEYLPVFGVYTGYCF
jgi:hypothetical protein